jgi:hypothetical protein
MPIFNDGNPRFVEKIEKRKAKFGKTSVKTGDYKTRSLQGLKPVDS